MIIRDYKASDLPAIFEMWQRQGIPYPFPNPDNPRFVTKLVVENGNKRPEMALFLRMSAEAYFLLDKEAGTPDQRLEHFKAIHDRAEMEMLAKGYEDVYAELSPEVAKKFGKRLLGLGWSDDGWKVYSKRLVEV